jgi:hypothetical protein
MENAKKRIEKTVEQSKYKDLLLSIKALAPDISDAGLIHGNDIYDDGLPKSPQH